MAMLIEPLGLRTPMAAFNGGIFVNPDMAPITTHLLPPEVARRALGIIMQHGMDVWVYSGNEWFIRNLDAPHVMREQRTVKFGPTVIGSFERALDSAVNCRRERRSCVVARCASRYLSRARPSVGCAFPALLP
jgi:hydroxymethylpyrimidine pyrophosphatase-like HAD family hydrolase